MLPVMPRAAADGGGATVPVAFGVDVNVSVWGNNGTKGADDNGGMSAAEIEAVTRAHAAGTAVGPVMGFETWCLSRGE